MKYRVLQILPELNVGGVETGTVDFAKYLVEHGHGAVVVSHGGSMVKALAEDGIPHYALPVHKKNIFTAISCVKALRKIIEKERIQIVHARSRVPAWIAYFACRKTSAEFITTCHGYYSRHVLSRVMGWAKFVIVPSDVIGRHMVESFYVPSDSIRRIPRSVDLAKFAGITREDVKGKRQVTISIVGRLTPLKGHVYFLRAMARVVRSMPYVKIWIIGDAPSKKEAYRQELEALSQRLGLGDQVEFLGNRRDIPQLLAKTDVLVMSSVVPEAFGRVILEAQAMHVPVVATSVGGVVDIIEHERTGLLVMAKDPDDMAAAVLRVLQDKALAARMVKAGHEKLLQQYTLKHMAEQTLAVYKELMQAQNILVVKISAIGDVVLVTAALKALRKKYPRAKICCLTGQESRSLLQRCPYVDELLVIDLQGREKTWWGLYRFSRKLARMHFDKVIDFQNNRRSHLLTALSFCRASYGYDNGKWGRLLDHRVRNDQPDMPPVQHQFRVLEMLGIDLPPDARLEMWLSKKDQQYIQELLETEWVSGNQKLVGINLAASEHWETKNWPLEHMARLCDLLAHQNIRMVLTGTDRDRDRAQALIKKTKTKVINFTGKTDLQQLAALIARCDAYVTPDSAPLHISAAVGVPFVALFGPTSSRRHLPPADKGIVLERSLPCAPCYSGTCRIKTHACLQDLSPEEVASQILELMGTP